MKSRNTYIDMIRGIAALGVICIHTAFWSGESYVPAWLKSLTLAIDVPLFFFLSGWGSSFRNSDIIKSCKSIGKIWLKWIYFVTLLAIFCMVSQYLPYTFEGVGGLSDLVNNYMFNVSFPGFRVIRGSIWFMEFYFVITLFNSIIMMFIEKSERKIELKKFYCILLPFIFIWITYGRVFIPISNVIIFYSFFWMLGQNKELLNINSLKKGLGLLLLVILGYIVSAKIQGISIFDVQSSKFPPSLMYGFFSMIVIIIVLTLEPFVKKTNKILVHIGQNAIFYYFGQGIGSSLLFLLMDNLAGINVWYLKFLVALCINILFTGIVAEFLAYSYKFVENSFKKLIVK